jgi:hypothetical protein
MIEVNLAFDISTTCIGISVIDFHGEHIESGYLKFKVSKKIPEKDKLFMRAITFKSYLDNIKNNYIVKNIFVETPLGNSNNRFTANLLTKFNGMCSMILFEKFEVSPVYIDVYEIRRYLCPEFLNTKNKNKKGEFTHKIPKGIDPKLYIWKKINDWFSNIEWEYNKKGELIGPNFDRTDAIAVNLASMIREGMLDYYNIGK